MVSGAYQHTRVSVSRSQEQIRHLLIKFGASGVVFSEDFEKHAINIRFAKAHEGDLRTVSVTAFAPAPAPAKVKNKRSYYYQRGKVVFRKSADERQEQLLRATYRVMHDWLKAQFLAVEFGLLSFEDVFLSHFEWIIGGQHTTVGRVLQRYLDNPARLLGTGSRGAEEVVEGEILPESSPRGQR